MFNNRKIRFDFRARFASFLMKNACRHYLKPKKFDMDFPENLSDRKYLLYLHIPFCFSFCTYCTFHKFLFDKKTAKDYFSLLKREMQLVKEKGYNFGAMYIGGGTPTVLPEELKSLIDYAKDTFDIKEVSCESDPDHILSPILKNTVGRIQRLSVGIQTFNDSYLKMIGRFDKFGSGEEILRKLKEIIPHFPIVNVDMIYNYPGQTSLELGKDIQKAVSSGASQITFYPLMFSSSGGWGLKNLEGEKSYQRGSAFFSQILDEMKIAGYLQRTPWAFSKDNQGLIDEYVIDNNHYIGLGSGAFSFVGNTLYINSFSLKEYGEIINKGRISAVKSIEFNSHAIKQYRMMVDLFGFNFSVKKFTQPEATLIKLSEIVKSSKGLYGLTPQGEFIISLMMSEFYNGMNSVRSVMRSNLTISDATIL